MPGSRVRVPPLLSSTPFVAHADEGLLASSRPRSRPRPMRPPIVWLLASTIAVPGVASAQLRRDPVPRLAHYVERSRAIWGVPGVAVVVVKDDSVVFLRGFGTRTVGKPEPVGAETIFAIASISKTFTGTALAMLVADRTITWDDRVTRWLPWFQLEDPYVTRETRIRDLMSHRTGLGQQADMLWYMSGYHRDSVIARVRFLHPNASFRSVVG